MLKKKLLREQYFCERYSVYYTDAANSENQVEEVIIVPKGLLTNST